MAETTTANYTENLSQALMARKDWFEKTELAHLKDELRVYQASYAALYSIFLKKKLINEDPYKQDTKIGELEVPETGVIPEAKRIEQMSLRLANFDNQMDFLVNFYQFGVDFLNLERIKRIVGLVRYIDWVNLTPDAQSYNTRVVAEIANQSKTGVDQLTLSIIGESLSKLSKSTASTMGILKSLTTYHKENYKLNVRGVIKGMPAAEATPANIKKKIASGMPGTPFYQECIDELIKEDYSGDGPVLQETVLKGLKIADDKPKTTKPKVSFKAILLEGIQVMGSTANILGEIGGKLDENEAVLASRKKGLWEKIRELLRQMMNAEPDEVIFDLQYTDPAKGTTVREQISFHNFRANLDKKIKILTGMLSGGSVLAKLMNMPEEQTLSYLERTIRDVQAFHRTLGALDEYFKTQVVSEDRDRIRGIKPELSTVKNCLVRANQLQYEYSAQKEEEEQLKRMGISLNGQ
ncbi:MAG: hypothetical protein LBH97_02235 [Treponema sp.]|jgi:hypothetical protein|nr:hypothetical protein [Treponema sp.]